MQCVAVGYTRFHELFPVSCFGCLKLRYCPCCGECKNCWSEHRHFGSRGSRLGRTLPTHSSIPGNLLYSTYINSLINCFVPLQVQLVIVARNFIIPLLFRMAGLVEGFHPRGALKMMLLRYIWWIPYHSYIVRVWSPIWCFSCRMFVLYFSSLYVLVVALFTLSSTCEVSLCRLYAGDPLHFIASPPSAGNLSLLLGDYHWTRALQTHHYQPPYWSRICYTTGWG